MVGYYAVAALTHYGFGIELPKRGYFAYAAFEVALSEKITGAGENLPAHHFLVGEVIAVDDYVVESSLLAFGNTDFYIHRVVLDIGFHRSNIKEEIAVVAIELGNIHFVLLAASVQSLFHGNNIIDISFLYTQHRIQGISGKNRIARPGNIPEIIFFPFLHNNIYPQTTRLQIINGILYYTGIAIAGLIEGAEQGFLVVGIFFGIELFGIEEVIPFVALGLLHASSKLIFPYIVIAYKVNLPHFNLFAPFHCKVHANGIADYGIFLNFSLYCAIQEAFFGKKSLY